MHFLEFWKGSKGQTWKGHREKKHPTLRFSVLFPYAFCGYALCTLPRIPEFQVLYGAGTIATLDKNWSPICGAAELRHARVANSRQAESPLFNKRAKERHTTQQRGRGPAKPGAGVMAFPPQRCPPRAMGIPFQHK